MSLVHEKHHPDGLDVVLDSKITVEALHQEVQDQCYGQRLGLAVVSEFLEIDDKRTVEPFFRIDCLLYAGKQVETLDLLDDGQVNSVRSVLLQLKSQRRKVRRLKLLIRITNVALLFRTELGSETTDQI